ncbi:T-complex protein 11-like protein 2 [Acipenser oxyrinchus oxyrinchus]|uniref:T-complex protein 11-like protein 2 n=1 Tax=Acipenser oxyrinchus oxyrinchus TaxID=40147 RepID=A0AAD8DGK5_ACIOX|nr:T-complex protein 11-like protein 2 [Acipenser oxyrinchus oxyrinchus]
MPLNDGRPSTSTSDDQNSDTESSERCDSMTSSSDTECSRQSFTSDSSSKRSSPASSPPKMVTFDDLMTSARDLSNLSLAHEIVMVKFNNAVKCLSVKSFNMTEALENVSAQIRTELNKSLTEQGYPALPAQVQVALTGQICTIEHKDNSIRNLTGKLI